VNESATASKHTFIGLCHPQNHSVAFLEVRGVVPDKLPEEALKLLPVRQDGFDEVRDHIFYDYVKEGYFDDEFKRRPWREVDLNNKDWTTVDDFSFKFFRACIFM
jgi:hypothetical protein